ncbi:glycerate kinase [Corynebacterium terpenotabidum]|uniref:glycerate kinase n=1 Tax=Corynebacterium terpenotabidum TaxID=89154 RepID=UPI001FE155B1|nr:glycerate kinase [Corynebacterium terpenotabidum]
MTTHSGQKVDRVPNVGGRVGASGATVPIPWRHGHHPHLLRQIKGSATSDEVARALATGLERSGHRVLTSPLADGGDGTLEVFDHLGHERESATVRGSDGRHITAEYSLHQADHRAVIETARICGLDMVTVDGATPPVEDARRAGSWGVGDVLVDAMDRGARRIILTLGGSATTDAGTGMASALGVVFRDDAGTPVGGIADMARITAVDLGGLDPRIADLDVVLASDVTNPLYGPDGAAAVYGPQKGLTPDAVPEVDAAVRSVAAVVERALGCEVAELPGAGAAGGLGFMAMALLGARMRPGVDLVLEATGFADLLVQADLVITGEGRIDAQTLSGKAPAGVAERARAAGVPVVAVCGQNLLAGLNGSGADLFDRVYALTDIEPDVASCIRSPGPVLTRIGQEIGVLIG